MTRGATRLGVFDECRPQQAIADDWNWNDEAQPSSPSLAIAAVRSVSQNDMFQDCWEVLPLASFNARYPVDLYSSSQ